MPSQGVIGGAVAGREADADLPDRVALASERAIAAGQYIGLALLAGLMGLAFYNDILGLVPR